MADVRLPELARHAGWRRARRSTSGGPWSASVLPPTVNVAVAPDAEAAWPRPRPPGSWIGTKARRSPRSDEQVRERGPVRRRSRPRCCRPCRAGRPDAPNARRGRRASAGLISVGTNSARRSSSSAASASAAAAASARSPSVTTTKLAADLGDVGVREARAGSRRSGHPGGRGSASASSYRCRRGGSAVACCSDVDRDRRERAGLTGRTSPRACASEQSAASRPRACVSRCGLVRYAMSASQASSIAWLRFACASIDDDDGDVRARRPRGRGRASAPSASSMALADGGAMGRREDPVERAAARRSPSSIAPTSSSNVAAGDAPARRRDRRRGPGQRRRRCARAPREAADLVVRAGPSIAHARPRERTSNRPRSVERRQERVRLVAEADDADAHARLPSSVEDNLFRCPARRFRQMNDRPIADATDRYVVRSVARALDLLDRAPEAAGRHDAGATSPRPSASRSRRRSVT